MEITCEILTRDRYFSTLPLALMSVCQQTIKPKYMTIIDDGEQKDLRKEFLYQHLFSLLSFYGIEWKVIFGNRSGIARNRMKSLEVSKTELIFRCDDDVVLEPDVLEKLLSTMDNETGAVAPLIIQPTSIRPLSALASNKISDIYLGLNRQWYLHPAGSLPEEVEHLYSSFLFRKSLAVKCAEEIGNELSPASHREDTILSHEIHRQGYKTVINPSAIMWHMRNPQGGIRVHAQQDFVKDEAAFSRRMSKWGVKPTAYSFVVLNNGIGDHYAFKNILPDYLENNKDKKNVFFVCYPEVFERTRDLKLASIAEAKQVMDIEKLNIYKWMIDNRWKSSITEAYKRMYTVSAGLRIGKKLKEGMGNKIVISPYSHRPDHPKSYPYWNEFVSLLTTMGYEVTQIGVEGEMLIPGIKYLWNAPFKKIEKLIEECYIWISSDNFLQHMVDNMFEPVPGIVIYGTSNPEYFGYKYNINIVKSTKFLRNNQYDVWNEKRNNDAFFLPELLLQNINTCRPLCLQPLPPIPLT